MSFKFILRIKSYKHNGLSIFNIVSDVFYNTYNECIFRLKYIKNKERHRNKR
jgi:hypothetical protein